MVVSCFRPLNSFGFQSYLCMELKSVVLFIPKNNIIVAAPLSKLPVNFLFGDYRKLTSYLLISCTKETKPKRVLYLFFRAMLYTMGIRKLIVVTSNIQVTCILTQPVDQNCCVLLRKLRFAQTK